MSKFITFLCFFFLAGCDSGSYRGAPSDHFDGNVFFNNPKTESRSFKDTFKWWRTRTRVDWPKQVTNTAHPLLKPQNSQDIIVTFINHATVLLQSQHYTILTDPIWSQVAGPFSWLGVKRVRAPGIALDALPRIDMVLISHSHYDHMDIPTLQALEKAFHPVFLVPLGNKGFLERQGLTHVVELDWWQSYPIPHGQVTFLPTQHWSARWLNDRNKTLWGSFGISMANHLLYFGGDAGYSPHYTEIQAKWGSPEIAFLSIGAYKPRWFMKPHHLDPAEAVQAMKDLHAKHAIGMHFGTFQLGDDGYGEPIQDLMTAKKAAKVPADQFFLLDQGESWRLGSLPPKDGFVVNK